MGCKHMTVQGNTTKYFYCNVFNKAVDTYKCENCMMKIENQEDLLKEMFGGVFGKGFGK